MRYAHTWFVVAAALFWIGGLKGDGLSVEERLSLSFGEIALTNGASLLLKVKDFDKERLYVRYGELGIFQAVTNGSVHVIEKGNAFSFRYSRSPAMTISLVESAEVEKRFPHVPSEFRQSKENMLLFEDGSNVTLISPQKNISYTLGKGEVKSFRFPFRGVWRDAREFDLWSAGKPYRGRLDGVKKRVEAEKAAAESAREYVRMRFSVEIESAVFDGDSTQAKLSVSLECQNRLPSFGKAVLLIEKTEGGRHLSGLGLLPVVDGGLSHQYLFDRAGHLMWHLSRDPSKRNRDGVFDGPDGFSIFELAPDGTIRRAFFGNVLPLLVVTERTFYFTGDGELVRQFLSDYVAASRHWGLKPYSRSDWD